MSVPGRWPGSPRPRGLLFCAALGVVAPAAHGAEMELAPVADTTIYEDDGGAGTGAGSFLFVGPLASGSPRRALLRFDLSALPPGAIVQSVALRLVINRAAIGAALDDPHRLQRVLSTWGEGSGDGGSGGGGGPASAADATWTHRFWGSPAASGPSWSTVGGDAAGPSAQFPLGGVGVHVVASTPGLVADVQAWLANPASNHGWLLSGPEGPDYSQKARRLLARESPDVDGRPRLTVTYQAPVAAAEVRQVPLPAAALWALAGACLLLARPRRVAREA
jgi:hypothetical protein